MTRLFPEEHIRRQGMRVMRSIEAGHLRPIVDAVLPLHQASEAYTGKVKQRHGRGKIVVVVKPDGSESRPP